MNITESSLIAYLRMFYPLGLLLFLLLAVVCFWWSSRRSQRQVRQLHLELQSFQDRIALLETLLVMIREMGKISYFIGDVSSHNKQSDNDYGFPMLHTYLNSMRPEDREHFQENCRKLFLKAQENFTATYSLQMSGQQRRHLNSARLFTTPQLQQDKFLLLSQDTSELEKHSRELADAGSILQVIFDNLPGYIFIKNISSNFEYIRCNPSFSGLLQKNPADLIGKNDFEIFDRDLARRIRSVDMNTAAHHTISDHRWFFSTPDGKEHAIRVISRPLRRADGSEWIIFFGIDVTRQELIANKLRSRNKELRLLLAQQTTPSMLLDNQLHQLCATPAMQKIGNRDTDTVNTPSSCPEICRCGITDQTQCPALLALRDGEIHFCSHCRLGDYQLKIQPLRSTAEDFNYLAVQLVPRENSAIERENS